MRILPVGRIGTGRRRFAFAGFVLASALAACGDGREARRAPPAEPPAKSSEVYDFRSGDNEMNSAIVRARETVGELLDVLEGPPPGETLVTAKARIEVDGGYEHIWLDSLLYEGGKLVGRLNTAPVKPARVGQGDEVRLLPGEVSDWMAINGGVMCGGFTMRVVLRQMPPERREAWLREFEVSAVPPDTAVCGIGEGAAGS